MSLDLGQGVKMELVLIPAGKFMMGSPETEKYRLPDETQHDVTISQPFYIGKFEVTQEQYEAVMGTNPAEFKGPKNPVDSVSWENAQEFCKKLSAKTGKTTQLPTEAQWEYACRSGTRTRFYSGDADRDLDGVGWSSGNSESTTHPVGGKRPNSWGLYDMHGNVAEWCQDWLMPYTAGAATDPKGAPTGNERVLRGGCWSSGPTECRAARRAYINPGTRYIGFSYGFRLVAMASPLTPSDQPETKSLEPATPPAPPPAGVAAYAKQPGLVLINARSAVGEGQGTGFAVHSTAKLAHIITNYHVIKGFNEFVVTYQYEALGNLARKTSSDVKILGTDQVNDLALLEVGTETEIKRLLLRPTTTGLSVPMKLTMIGRTKGLDFTVMPGELANLNRTHEGKRHLLINSNVDWDMSGGPVIDENGYVVGVTVAKVTGLGQNIAILTEHVRDLCTRNGITISLYADR